MLQLINTISMENIPPELVLNIFHYFDTSSRINILKTYPRWCDIISNSSKTLKYFELQVDRYNIEDLLTDPNLKEIPYRKLSVSFDYAMSIEKVKTLLHRYKDSIENIKLVNFKARNFAEFYDVLIPLKNLKYLNLKNCRVDNLKDIIFPSFSNLKSISFNKCHDSLFGLFKNQPTLEKLIVINNDASWNGFNHDGFTNILKNAKNCKEVVLKGAGTGSYFDNDDYPFSINKLVTTMITYRWYVGLKSKRIDFLFSQQECLKELTIDQLPNDFDGGEVLKFIIEEMKLENFYYGKIPLILNGRKQEVYEFDVTETQITCMFEMARQFATIKKVKITLNKTEVSSDEIEKNVNPFTTLFNNIEELEVEDNSGPNGIFGIFLGSYKNFRNIRRLKLKTQDENVNIILEECLKNMNKLEEIYLTSTAPRVNQIFNAIDKFSPNIKKLSVATEYVEIAQNHFRKRFKIYSV